MSPASHRGWHKVDVQAVLALRPLTLCTHAIAHLKAHFCDGRKCSSSLFISNCWLTAGTRAESCPSSVLIMLCFSSLPSLPRVRILLAPPLQLTVCLSLGLSLNGPTLYRQLVTEALCGQRSLLHQTVWTGHGASKQLWSSWHPWRRPQLALSLSGQGPAV